MKYVCSSKNLIFIYEIELKNCYQSNAYHPYGKVRQLHSHHCCATCGNFYRTDTHTCARVSSCSFLRSILSVTLLYSTRTIAVWILHIRYMYQTSCVTYNLFAGVDLSCLVFWNIHTDNIFHCFCVRIVLASIECVYGIQVSMYMTISCLFMCTQFPHWQFNILLASNWF